MIKMRHKGPGGEVGKDIVVEHEMLVIISVVIFYNPHYADGPQVRGNGDSSGFQNHILSPI